MWNIFRKNNIPQVDIAPQVKTYTAADVMADLTAKMLLLMEDIRECVEHKQSEEIQVELFRLKKLGLNNTANAEALKKAETQIAEYNKKVDTLKFMQHAWNKYGKDVMVVSYAHFMEILEKYDLVCGSLDRYTGAIPEDNLKELDNLYKMHEKGEIDENEALEFEIVRGIGLRNVNDVSEIIKFARFPFHINGIALPTVYEQMGIKDLRDISEIQAIHRLVYGNMFRTELLDEQGDVIVATETPVSASSFPPKPKHTFDSQFFIAAPCEEMNRIKFNCFTSLSNSSKVDALRKFESLEKYCELVETKDPFICSFTPYGIMIHSKWGDEAQDEIIKRYEKLSETINQNKVLPCTAK